MYALPHDLQGVFVYYITFFVPFCLWDVLKAVVCGFSKTSKTSYADMKKDGFMSFTAAGHQGAINFGELSGRTHAN